MTRIPKKGERVAHRALDDSKGAAQSGIVSDVVGDEEQQMIVLESEEGRRAYDSRELITLGSAEKSSGPVVLRPRHFLRSLRSFHVLIALLFEISLIVAVLWAVIVLDWDVRDLRILGGLCLVVGLAVVLLLDRDAQRERNGKPE